MYEPDHGWWRPFHSIDEIRIVHVDLHPDAAREREAVTWLDARESARWQRFRVERPRRQFSLCRSALRRLLCRILDCANDRLRFGIGEHGKPFALVDGHSAPVSFNISHSGTHGLIAVAPRGELGVDVEIRSPRRDFDGLGRSVFGPNEQVALAAKLGHEKAQLFFSLWTMKEALIKALGTGFTLNPSRFEVPAPMLAGKDAGRFRFPDETTYRWRLRDLGESRFAAALAYDVRDTPSPRLDPVTESTDRPL